MTQKKQWLLFGAIFGVGIAAAWALVGWGGLLSLSPPTPPGSVAVSRAPNNTPAPRPQAVLPFNIGRGTGGAGLPFGKPAAPTACGQHSQKYNFLSFSIDTVRRDRKEL
jgi:hypothetical protein